MNAADEWLNKNTGYCVRLSARITPEQCEINHRAEFLCGKCEGLDMRSKHPRCTVEGCDKQAWKGGMCYRHFNQQQRATGIQNQEALEEIADELPEVHDVAPELPTENPLLPPPIAPSRAGIFIDFTGQEDLMRWLFDMCGDTDASVAVLGLLKARKDGLLRMEVA